MLLSKKRRCPINVPGSKSTLMRHLLPYCPEHIIFVDVFGGGGASTYNKPASQFEVWNDVDWNHWNALDVMTDDALRDDLIFWLSMTPHNRKQWWQCIKLYNDSKCSRLTRAWAFMFANRTSFNGHMVDARKSNYARKKHRNLPRSWAELINNVAARFKNVELTNQDFGDCIQRCDSPETLFYCDPPYVLATLNSHRRPYRHMMADDEHYRLSVNLRAVQGKVVLSGYPSELYDDLFWDWWTVDIDWRRIMAGGHNQRPTIERLWMNFA